ncbi:MAG: peptide deformylase [Ignavibacteria bacterium]|nr:peptide deformylase [Ignavibacteria bacterium]
MAVIPITQYGDRILREKAKKIKNVDDKIITLIRDMFETMRKANGVGLAANQVGNGNSLFTIDLTGVEGCEKIKPLVMINPEIIASSDELVTIEEGCLSLPNLRADVDRPEKIQIKYIDTDEKEVIIEADDFLARVIQHEYDHLQGKMIPDRVESYEKNKMKNELMRIMKREVEVNYPITDR